MAVVCAQLSFFGPSVGAVAGKGFGSRNGYASLTCRASSGGTRRDYEKILAREQKRRVRHMKGVTPSTPDLINQLDSETKDQAKLDSYPDEEYDDEEDFEDDGGSLPLDEAVVLSPGGATASYVGGDHVAYGSEDNGGLADLTEETGSAVSDTAGG